MGVVEIYYDKKSEAIEILKLNYIFEEINFTFREMLIAIINSVDKVCLSLKRSAEL